MITAIVDVFCPRQLQYTHRTMQTTFYTTLTTGS